MTSKKQTPLLQFTSPFKAKAYRGTFKAFATTRYLDPAALAKVKKTVIEIGTIEAAGLTRTLAAEIKRGQITALMPLACAGCQGKKAVGLAQSSSGRRKTKRMAEALSALKAPSLTLPLPVKVSRQRGLTIPIGPIVIVIDGGGVDDGFCIQITIIVNDNLVLLCICCTGEGCACW